MFKKNYYPKISVVMNCHNGEKYLKQSIKSVLKQSYKNLELIFYDNKSNDKAVKGYITKDVLMKLSPTTRARTVEEGLTHIIGKGFKLKPRLGSRSPLGKKCLSPSGFLKIPNDNWVVPISKQ